MNFRFDDISLPKTEINSCTNDKITKDNQGLGGETGVEEFDMITEVQISLLENT